jgi:hypothetical protein
VGDKRFEHFKIKNAGREAECYEGIGIVSVSDTLLDVYNVDWMRKAVLVEISIV